MGSRRFVSIDMMRCLAIVGMVLCHFVLFWSVKDRSPLAYFFGGHILGDWPAAFFLVIVGVSLAVSLTRREDKGEDMRQNRIRGVKRGLFVFAIGLLLSVCTSGLAAIFTWNILTLIGTAIILIEILREVKPSLIVLLCTAVILVTPPLQKAVGYIEYWGGAMSPDAVMSTFVPNLLYNNAGYYTPGFGMDAVTGFFVTGFFPVFPWIIFPLAGFLAGKVLFTSRMPVSPAWKFPQSLGILCIILGLLLGYAGSLHPSSDITGTIAAPFSFYPETTPMLLVQFGLACCVIWLFRQWFDGERQPAFWERTAERISRYSLSLYIIHLLILEVPMEILYWMDPESVPFMATISPVTALVLGVLFLIGFTILSGYWDRMKGRYSFEWIMAKVIGD